MDVRLTKSREDWVASYLTIWQGFLSLTEKELEVATLLALRYLSLRESIQDPALIAELLLSPGYKVSIRENVRTVDGKPLSANGLQNYLTALREKNVLQAAGSRLTLNPLLIPEEQITFHFTISD